MSVASVGTPSPQRATSGFTSVAGAWGTGQNRVAGHLLLAVVSGGPGGTTITWSVTENSSTWTQQFSFANTVSGTAAACGIAVFTKVAAGSDAAPSFNTNITGAAAGCTVTLFEFSGANTTTPIDTSGTQQTGGSTSTVSFSVTTGGNVATAGEYGIFVASQQRNSALLTWTETGSGWTSLYEDNVTSASHTQINTQSNPTAGATLSDAGHFSTNTSAFGAGLVFAVAAAPVILDYSVPRAIAPPMIPPQLWDQLLAVAEYRMGSDPVYPVPPFTYQMTAVPGAAIPGFSSPGDPVYLPPPQADEPLLAAVAPPVIPPQLWEALLAVAAYRLAGLPIPSTELITAVIAAAGTAAGAKTAQGSAAGPVAAAGTFTSTRTAHAAIAGPAAEAGTAAAVRTAQDFFTGRAAASGKDASARTAHGFLTGPAAATTLASGINANVGGLNGPSAAYGTATGSKVSTGAFTGAAAGYGTAAGSPPVTGSFTGAAAPAGRVFGAPPVPPPLSASALIQAGPAVPFTVTITGAFDPAGQVAYPPPPTQYT